MTRTEWVLGVTEELVDEGIDQIPSLRYLRSALLAAVASTRVTRTGYSVHYRLPIHRESLPRVIGVRRGILPGWHRAR